MRTIYLKGDAHDHQRMYAVMMFPEDELFRNSYLRRLIDLGKLPDDPNVVAPTPGDAPRWLEMQAIAEDATRAGLLGGQLLLVRAIMDAQGMQEPSSRKATQAMQVYYERGQYGDGKPVRASPRKVEGKDFVRLRNVAHLWAAWAVFHTDYGKAKARNRMRTKRGIQRFLRIAAYLQQFGLAETTPRQNRNAISFLLDSAQIWRVPAGTKPVSPKELPVFKPEMLEWLKNYSHT